MTKLPGGLTRRLLAIVGLALCLGGCAERIKRSVYDFEDAHDCAALTPGETEACRFRHAHGDGTQE